MVFGVDTDALLSGIDLAHQSNGFISIFDTKLDASHTIMKEDTRGTLFGALVSRSFVHDSDLYNLGQLRMSLPELEDLPKDLFHKKESDPSYLQALLE